MKKLALLLICLALILGVGMASGAMAEGEPQLRLREMYPGGHNSVDLEPDGTITVNRAVVHYDWQGGNGDCGYDYASEVCDFYIQDWDQLREQYPEADAPEWSVEVQEGLELDSHFEVWEDGGRCWIWIGEGSRPQEPAQGQLTVTCAWLGQTVSAHVDLDFQDVELPTRVDFPSIIDVTKGQPTEFGWNYDIEDFYWDVAWLDGFLVGNGEESFYNINDFFEWGITSGTLTLEPMDVDPGYYVWDMHIRNSGFEIHKDVLVRVHASDDSIPDPVMELSDHRDVTYFLPGYENAQGYETELCPGETCFIRPDNYLMLSLLYGDDYGDDYHWEFEEIEGLDIEFVMDDDCNANLTVNNFREVASGTTATLHATLYWGDLHADCTFDLTFRDVVLPAQIDWPGDLVLTLDQDEFIEVNLDDNEWERERCLWYDFARYGRQWAIEQECLNPERTRLKGHETGVFAAIPHIHASNLFIYGPTAKVVVKEADGEAPDLVLRFDDDACENYETTRAIFEDNEGIGLFHDSWVRNYVIEDYDIIEALIGGEPEWSVVPVGETHGARISGHIWGEDHDPDLRGFDVNIDNEPNEPCTIAYKVTCTWEGLDPIEGNCTITYDYPPEIPDDLRLAVDDAYHGLQVNTEPFEIPISWQPDTFTFGEARDFHVGFGCDYNGNNWWDWKDGVPTQFIEPHEPGVYQAWISAIWANIRLEKPIILYVADENGEEPGPEILLQDDREVNRTFSVDFRDNEDVFSDNWVGNAVIENYDVLRALLEGGPEWSYEILEGDVEPELHPWDDRRGADLNFDTLPDGPSVNRYVIRCEWGGLSVERNMSVSFIGDGDVQLPDGGTVDPVIRLRPGESTRVDVDFNPSTFGIEDPRLCYWFHDDDMMEYMDVEENTEERWVEFTPHEGVSGVFGGTLYICSGNVCAGRRDVAYVISEGEDDYPFEVHGGPNFEVMPILDQWWEGDYGSVDLHTEDVMANFWFDESYYEVMRDHLRCEPDWRYTQTDGDDIETELQLYDDDSNARGAMLLLRSMPEEPEDVTFKVTCSWGDYQFDSGEFTISFVDDIDDDIELPESLNIEDHIYMIAGEATEIPYTVTPENWSIANDRHFDFWPVGGDDVDHDMWIDEEDGKLYARIYEPGLYVCCVFLREGSIVLPKRYVTFHVVAGEDEEYPELVFRFTDEAMYEPDNTFLIFEENEEIGMIRDAFVTRFEIENFYGMRALRAGDPKWTLEQLDHTDEVKLRAQNYFWEDRFDGLRGFEVFANKMPEEPIDVSYRVRCEWNGEVIEALGKLHFVVPDHLPTGVDIPDLIELKIDQENPIDLHFTFPEGFDFFDNDEFGYNANPRINIDWHDDFDREDWCEGHTLIINSHQCGEFHAWVGVTTCNLNFGKEVTFIVTGEDEPEQLEVQGGPWFKEVAILNQFWEGDYGNTDLHTEDIMAEFFFPEDSYYARRAELGTTPEWHITRQGSDDIGEDFDFVLFDEGSNPRGATLCLRRMPEQPMEVTFTVTCDWGDYHYNSERESFTLSFVDTIPMPERLDIADVIDMNVGERTEVPYAVSPENWHCAEDRHFEVRVAGDQEYVDFHKDYDTENDKLYVTIDRPGTYSAIVFLREGSLVLPKRYVTFRVADRGGKAPRLRFEGDWMRNVHRTFARFEENEESALTHDNFVCDYCLDNSFEALWIQNKADPEWAVPQWDVTWEQTDGVTLSINNYDWEGEPWAHRGIQLFAEGMPDAECEVNYTVTCAWGDQSLSARGTIEYVDVDEMPTGVDIPDEIELDLNEMNAIDLSFVPDYFSFGEDDRIYYEFYDGFDREDWEDGHTIYIVPHEPGAFAGRVGVISGNISIGKDVLFKVTDDNYDLPDQVEPILCDYRDVYNIAIVPEEEGDVRGDEWIDDLSVKNAVAMRNAYGDVEWSIVQTEGEPLEPWAEYRDHGCAFFIGRQPTQPGTAKFIITGDWGDGVTGSVECVLNIMDSDLPTGAILYRDGEEIDEITMIAEETAEITSAFVPDADWRLPDREDRVGFDMWMDGVDNEDNPYFSFEGVEDDPFTVLLTAKQPGVYYLGSHTRSGNVLAYREIKVTVTDEEGHSGQIAPILEDDFEMDIMLGELMDDENTGWLIRPGFWYMEPLNLRALREIYGDDANITWNVEIVDGDGNVGIAFETFEAGGVQNAGAEFRLTSMPAGPGPVVIRITTGWRSNGSDSDYMEASLEGTLNFIQQPDNVPETNDLPDRLRLRVGERIDLYGYYVGESFGINQDFAWIGIDDQGVRVEEDRSNPHHLVLTGVNPGFWYGEALVGEHARGMTRKWITIMVYDDSDYTTMTLPAALSEIGEESFEGIAANRVIIPDGCQRIEARAFANCPNLREIHIPDSVWSIGDDVFDGSGEVVIITTNPTVQDWADRNYITWFDN